MVKASPAVTPEEHVVTKTTTIREVLPSNEGSPPGQRKTPEFFEFVRSIPEDKMSEYMIYLYRVEPGRVQIDHTPGRSFDVPGYGIVPVLDLEAIETVVTNEFGGGVYRLICTKRSSGEWQTQVNFRIDLPPRNVVPWFVKRGENKPNQDGKPGQQYDPATAIASQAIQTIASRESEAIGLGLRMMDSAAGHILRANQPDDIIKQIQAAMLTKALNPPDPIEQMSRFMELQSRLNPNNGNGNRGGDDLNLDRFRSMISFVREFTGPGSPAVSVGAEIVRSVTNMVPSVVDGIREWRIGKEAERDAIAIAHSYPPPRPPAPAGVRPPQVLPPVNPTQPNPTQPVQPGVAVPPASVPPPNGGAPTIEFIEAKILEMIRMPVSAEEAASRTLEFLENLAGDNPPPDQDYVTQLTALGETGLVQLFQARPNLMPATNNTGRLLEFIRAFLRYHAQDLADERTAARPN